MKKLLISVAVATAALLTLQSCDKNDERIDLQNLPTTAQNFVAANFPGATVTSAVKDYDDIWGYNYDVILSDGTHIEFDEDGEWREVENRVSGVPTSVIPAKIVEYVSTNYAAWFVVDIEKERGYNVELSNDLDLDFDSDGNFVRIDN